MSYSKQANFYYTLEMQFILVAQKHLCIILMHFGLGLNENKSHFSGKKVMYAVPPTELHSSIFENNKNVHTSKHISKLE